MVFRKGELFFLAFFYHPERGNRWRRWRCLAQILLYGWLVKVGLAWGWRKGNVEAGSRIRGRIGWVFDRISVRWGFVYQARDISLRASQSSSHRHLRRGRTWWRAVDYRCNSEDGNSKLVHIYIYMYACMCVSVGHYVICNRARTGRGGHLGSVSHKPSRLMDRRVCGNIKCTTMLWPSGMKKGGKRGNIIYR